MAAWSLELTEVMAWARRCSLILTACDAGDLCALRGRKTRTRAKQSVLCRMGVGCSPKVTVLRVRFLQTASSRTHVLSFSSVACNLWILTRQRGDPARPYNPLSFQHAAHSIRSHLTLRVDRTAPLFGSRRKGRTTSLNPRPDVSVCAQLGISCCGTDGAG
jgi:hypothetical protein